jgi:hypothetical protein
MEAVDTFSQSWQGKLNLLVLPFCLLLQVLHHLVESGAMGVLVCPRWEAQPWWPMLMCISVQCLDLGPGREVTVCRPSGTWEPANGQWVLQAHLVDGRRFQQWRF